jgi:hypothetical protein
VYVPGWIRSFQDIDWDNEDLTNGLQEVQISCRRTFFCGAGQKRRCTEQILTQWDDWIQNVITNIPHNFLQKLVDPIPARFRKVVDAAVVYIEF